MAEERGVLVLIPTPLRRFTGGQARVVVEGATVGELLARLGETYPGLAERLCEEDGSIKRFVNVFVNGRNVRDGEGEATPLQDGDEVGVIPALAGGAIG